MNLDLVIAALRARCATFAGRIAGAAQYGRLTETTNVAVPSAFVLPMDDDPGEQQSSSGYIQQITDRFAVVVMLSNATDERGQGSSYQLHAIRHEIWRALLGWTIEPGWFPIQYEGGSLLDLDRARLSYQFEFSAVYTIGSTDTALAETRLEDDLAALPDFDRLHWRIDPIDPRDPSRPIPDDPRPIAEGEVDYPQP